MTETLHTDGTMQPRIELDGEAYAPYSISGVFDATQGEVWVDDLELPNPAAADVEEGRHLVSHFAEQASAAGANTLWLPCPELQDLQLLTAIFPADKFSFYENVVTDEGPSRIALHHMTVNEALASLQEIEAIQTAEYFPTNWFDVAIKLS